VGKVFEKLQAEFGSGWVKRQNIAALSIGLVPDRIAGGQRNGSWIAESARFSCIRMTICWTSAMLPALLLAAIDRALAMLRGKAAAAAMPPRDCRNKRRSTDMFHWNLWVVLGRVPGPFIGVRTGNFMLWFFPGRGKGDS
jgi:hypothetical protein